jgi:hypothetical protein
MNMKFVVPSPKHLELMKFYSILKQMVAHISWLISS